MSPYQLPAQLPQIRLDNDSRPELPRRLGTNYSFWLAWLVLAGALAAYLFTDSTAQAAPKSFLEYVRAFESAGPDWVYWARDGLLGAVTALLFAGFIFGRRFAQLAFPAAAALTAVLYVLKDPMAWVWGTGALVLLVQLLLDARLRLRQLRVLDTRDAPSGRVAPEEVPDSWRMLLPRRGMWLLFSAGLLAMLVGALLLAGPHRELLRVRLLPRGGNPLEILPLVLPVLGALIFLMVLGHWVWRMLIEARHGFVILELADLDPLELFVATALHEPSLPLAEALLTPGCICAEGMIPGADERSLSTALERIYVEEHCPAHGEERLNALDVDEFLALADKPWAYGDEHAAPGGGFVAHAPLRVLFNVSAMRGSTLRGAGVPSHGLMVEERLERRPRKERNGAASNLADEIDALEAEELIDVIDLRRAGMQGSALRIRGWMPQYFAESAASVRVAHRGSR